MVDLTFRTSGDWGPGKGANLQPAEVDSNFWSVAQAIVDLESNPAIPVGIESISMSGSEMTIYLTDGSTMGPFLIPVLTFAWRGEWQPSTSYAELDVFTVDAVGIFMTLLAHTSGATFDPDIAVDGAAALLQIFGAANASLATLGDVNIIEPIEDDSVLLYDITSAKWRNVQLGQMAFQDWWNVNITGGAITGIGPPVNPTDVATKAYVDALPAGMTAPSGTMMANIEAFAAPAVPTTLSDYLDYALGGVARGTLIYRSDTAWIALPAGTAGYFLQSNGPGLDVAWALGGSGVTSITVGAGLDASPDTIIDTGTIALAPIADDTLLANVSGAVTAPTPTTLTALLDSVLGTSRGQLLTRTVGGWVALAPGLTGQFLKTQGSGADLVWDSPVGAGTVTNIATGTGLTGGPITGTGTIALAAIADGAVLANTSGGSAAPVPTTVSLLFDRAFGTTQGSILYRTNAAWVMLTPGTTGQFLATGGAAANPSWQNAPTTGAAVPNLRIISNISGSSATPSGNTLTNILDAIISSVRGTLIYRTNSGWTGLAPGVTGQYLTTRGVAADPVWTTPGTGGVTIANGEVLGNATGSVAAPSGTNSATVLRAAIGDGTAGQVLTSSGAGVNPVWGAAAGLPSGTTHDQLVYVSGAWAAQRPKYVVACYVPGLQTASQNMLFHRFSKAVTIPANAGTYLGHTSEAAGSATATGSTVFTLAKALSASPTSFSDVGTITFSASSASGTFATTGGAAVTFAQGDILRLRAQATPDATLADFHMTLVGFET